MYSSIFSLGLMRSVLLVTLFLLLCAARPSAQALRPPSTGCVSVSPVTTLSCFELTLESPTPYPHPIEDLTLSVTYTLAGTASSLTVWAFWDGGLTYRARVALPEPGVWNYEVSATDVSNGLHGQRGTVDVLAYAGSDLFRTRGWLRVSDDHRYLTYGNGTPFFWLSDTAWEMPRSSYPNQIDPYLDDRLSKGFTMTSMVVNSHGYFFPYHIKNRFGEPFLLNNDRIMPNPRYFDYLDTVVGEANAKGLGVALVPLWATYAEVHRDTSPWTGELYSLEEALVIAKYVGARYAGHNVVWIVAGDQLYNSEEKRAYWDAFARRLDEASGGNHLMTVHPKGYTASFRDWPEAPSWLDFHMYQGSHIAQIYYLVDSDGTRLEDPYGGLRADGHFHWEGGLQGYNLVDTTPILSGESNYEDLFSRFWAMDGDTTRAERIQARDVRHAAYWGLLSGSTVGFTYGANGVWQWANEPEPGNLYPRLPPMEAIAFPGSAQMAVMRTFAEEHQWYHWVPCPELVHEVDARHFVPASCGNRQMILYMPTGTRQVQISPLPFPAQLVDLTWTHPITAAHWSEQVETVDGELILSPPDTLDWLVTLDVLTTPDDPNIDNQRGPVSLTHAGQNPSRGNPQINLFSDTAREIQLQLFDTRGRRLYEDILHARSGINPITLPIETSGTFFVRALYRDALARPYTTHLTLTVTSF